MFQDTTKGEEWRSIMRTVLSSGRRRGSLLKSFLSFSAFCNLYFIDKKLVRGGFAAHLEMILKIAVMYGDLGKNLVFLSPIL